MAITTLDGVISGMRPPEEIFKIGVTMQSAGIWHSTFYQNGRPGAAAAPTVSVTGAALSTYAGQVPWSDPVSGNTYLARFEASPQNAGAAMLADRLWHNAGLTVTVLTSQSVNSAAFPARDRDGSTNGENVLVAMEVTGTLGNAAGITNCTMVYTNSAGTGSRTATLAIIPTTAQAGTFLPFALQAGDTGVRSVQTIALNTSLVSGSISLVAYRQVAMVPCPQENVGAAVDAISSGFPRLYNGSVLFVCWLPSVTAPTNLSGQVIVTQG